MIDPGTALFFWGLGVGVLLGCILMAWMEH